MALALARHGIQLGWAIKDFGQQTDHSLDNPHIWEVVTELIGRPPQFGLRGIQVGDITPSMKKFTGQEFGRHHGFFKIIGMAVMVDKWKIIKIHRIQTFLFIIILNLEWNQPL